MLRRTLNGASVDREKNTSLHSFYYKCVFRASQVADCAVLKKKFVCSEDVDPQSFRLETEKVEGAKTER